MAAARPLERFRLSLSPSERQTNLGPTSLLPAAYKEERKFHIVVSLSGGQAPSSHQVPSGNYVYLRVYAMGSKLYGFKGGTAKEMQCKSRELSSELIYPYRNQNGFGRDGIDTPSQFIKSAHFIHSVEKMFERMADRSISCGNSRFSVFMMKWHANLHEFTSTYLFLPGPSTARLDFDSEAFMYNALIHICATLGWAGEAYQVCDDRPHRDLVTWNYMLPAYVQQDDPITEPEFFTSEHSLLFVTPLNRITDFTKADLEEGAIHTVYEMLLFGYVPSWKRYYPSNSYNPIHDVASSYRTGAATNVHVKLALGYKSVIILDADMNFRTTKAMGLIPNAVPVLDGLCMDGLIQVAMKHFGLMSQKRTIPEILIYMAMVDSCCKALKFAYGKGVFNQMQTIVISSHAFRYTVFVSGLWQGKQPNDGIGFCIAMLEAGHSPLVATLIELVEKISEAAQGVIQRLREEGQTTGAQLHRLVGL